jgi:hypothetical protein
LTDFQLGKYMVARLMPPQGKMDSYQILSVNHGSRLGTIKWNFPWHQYVLSFSDELIQKPGEELLFNCGCLEEISKFLRNLNVLEYEQRLRTTKLEVKT